MPRRDLWEARDVYLSMSPFLDANNLTGALLMYHNLADQNVGTDPTNSIRLYHALNGLGKTTALYMYPYEDHGPVAKETLLDLWARWAAWLDKYVKNPEKRSTRKCSPSSSRSGTERQQRQRAGAGHRTVIRTTCAGMKPPLTLLHPNTARS